MKYLRGNMLFVFIGALKYCFLLPIVLLWLFVGPGLFAVIEIEQAANPIWQNQVRTYLYNRGYDFKSIQQLDRRALEMLQFDVYSQIPPYTDQEAQPIAHFCVSWQKAVSKAMAPFVLAILIIYELVQPMAKGRIEGTNA